MALLVARRAATTVAIAAMVATAVSAITVGATAARTTATHPAVLAARVPVRGAVLGLDYHRL
jgi:hypothetical protein